MPSAPPDITHSKSDLLCLGELELVHRERVSDLGLKTRIEIPSFTKGEL